MRLSTIFPRLLLKVYLFDYLVCTSRSVLGLALQIRMDICQKSFNSCDGWAYLHLHFHSIGHFGRSSSLAKYLLFPLGLGPLLIISRGWTMDFKVYVPSPFALFRSYSSLVRLFDFRTRTTQFTSQNGKCPGIAV